MSSEKKDDLKELKDDTIVLDIQEEPPVNKKKEKERETWTGRFDFFLAALGYAGIKNIIKNLFNEK